MQTLSPKFSGIGDYPTLLSALVRGTDEGKPVKISANATVALCADGDVMFGVVKTIDPGDKAAVVQTKGFVTLPYTGIGGGGATIPTIGRCELDADGAGGVSKSGSVYYQVVNVDTSAVTVTFLLG